jgi:hypothetical protein
MPIKLDKNSLGTLLRILDTLNSCGGCSVIDKDLFASLRVAKKFICEKKRFVLIHRDYNLSQAAFNFKLKK